MAESTSTWLQPAVPAEVLGLGSCDLLSHGTSAFSWEQGRPGRGSGSNTVKKVGGQRAAVDCERRLFFVLFLALEPGIFVFMALRTGHSFPLSLRAGRRIHYNIELL